MQREAIEQQRFTGAPIDRLAESSSRPVAIVRRYILLLHPLLALPRDSLRNLFYFELPAESFLSGLFDICVR